MNGSSASQEGFSSLGENSSKVRACQALAEVYLFIHSPCSIDSTKAVLTTSPFPSQYVESPGPWHRILSPDTAPLSSRPPNKHKASWSRGLALCWQVGPELPSPSESLPQSPGQAIFLPWALVYPPAKRTNSHIH